MKLRGIDFGPCIDASGTRNFFGEGWWFHRFPFIKRWYNFGGSTFVAKSTTTYPTEGNMPFKNTFLPSFQPRELFPRCIRVDFFGKKMLNAVGLSGPGCMTIFELGFAHARWKKFDTLMISVAPEGKTAAERLKNFSRFVEILKEYLKQYPGLKIALQINLSCPNSNVPPSELIQEARDYLDIAAQLGIPLVIKVNLLVTIHALIEITNHPACDALCITNTLPFGELPDKVDWKKLYPKGSPLKKFGGGGLSGAPLFPLLLEMARAVYKAGITKPIIWGGGILRPEDVNELVHAGVRPLIDAVSIGSIATLCPWNIQPTIVRAHELLGYPDI